MTQQIHGGPVARRIVDSDTESVRHRIRISDKADDPRWDAFLASINAHHTQTAAWSRAKLIGGWRPLRVVIDDGEVIVAGMQLLHRSIGRLGSVAFLSRGPVTDVGDPRVTERVMEATYRAMRAARIRAMLIEPDPDFACAGHLACMSSLVPTSLRLSLGATVRVDVGRSPQDMLAAMKSKTRYNVRLAERRGIMVRHADVSEYPVFYRLLVQTGRRQGFEVAPAAHYRHWVETLGADDHLQLFLAEHRGEPVAAMVAITFGRTMVYKRGAWSGSYGELRPNEALHWTDMNWAHHAGYRCYDLDGIDRVPAELVLQGKPVPEHYLDSVTRFKLGFGGEVTLLPGSFLKVRGAAWRRMVARLDGSKQFRRAMAQLR